MTQAEPATGWPTEPPDDDQPARAAPGRANGHNPAPRDLDAERAVLGACLVGGRPTVTEARTLIRSTDDFYLPRHQLIWQHICALTDDDVTPDLITVPQRAARSGGRWSDDDRLYLHDLYDQAPIVLQVGYHARTVAEQSALRRIDLGALRLQQAARQAGATLNDPARRAEILEQIRSGVDALAGEHAINAARPVAVELDVFLEDADDKLEYDWVIPDVLERGDRVILTGQEGWGKSTLLRQLAVQAASGIHPFTGSAIPPQRVLYVDLENSRRQMRRKLGAVRIAAGGRYQPTPGLHMHARPQGLDLLDPDDARLLTELITDVNPDILIIGPIYKLVGGDPKEEGPARAASTLLDRLRTSIGFALLMEAHSPLGVNGGKRPERPYGASLWLRWPEFGLYLSPEGYLRHWRGDRDERMWPAAMKRGGEWPFTSVTKESDLAWARIVETCREMGDQPTQRDLAKLVGISQAKVSRLINDHRTEWDALSLELAPATESDEGGDGGTDLFGDQDVL